jgi:hypothetical protein
MYGLEQTPPLKIMDQSFLGVIYNLTADGFTARGTRGSPPPVYAEVITLLGLGRGSYFVYASCYEVQRILWRKKFIVGYRTKGCCRNSS